MKKKRSDQLQSISWEYAALLNLCTLQGLAALGYDPAKLRHWSANGNIHPVAKAPGGAFLFHTPTVIAAGRWLGETPEP